MIRKIEKYNYKYEKKNSIYNLNIVIITHSIDYLKILNIVKKKY